MKETRLAKEALQEAKKIAKSLRMPYIGTEHLLVALASDERMTSAVVLQQQKITRDILLDAIEEIKPPAEGAAAVKTPEESPKLHWVLDSAQQEAALSSARAVGTEHYLLAIIKTQDCAGARILNALEVDLRRLMSDLLDALGEEGEIYRAQTGARMQEGGAEGSRGTLEQFTSDLTQRAMMGELDPVIGRETQILRLMQVLCRRTKNNPCLIGEPGVGKTAIVEGLAQRIADGLVPDMILNKRLLVLDLSGMVAGTKYRGEFEQRIKAVIAEASANRDVILFIDEVHTLIGAGGAEGAMDAANILKPAMARGELQIIGATTTDEYRKRIEHDPALERRFAPVMVEEPTEEETRQILFGIRGVYEKYHDLEISDAAIDAAVRLSARYVADRFLPDKAIDVMDEAAARLRLFKSPGSAKDPVSAKERRLMDLDAAVADALAEGRIADAAALRREYEELDKSIVAALARNGRGRKSTAVLGENEIAAVVSEWTRIPVNRLNVTEMQRLRSMEKTLHKRVIGQEEAIGAVSRAVRRGRVGIKEPGRPVGSFLFLGPTGVGKTEISKALAEAVFGTENAMIRIDMSEYMEKHSVSKLIGSPPGYVGFEEGGQLSERVRRNPYAVLLFDEIEKAHPDVFNILLQVLDDGHITDAQGRKVDFKNTIIIMTSNAGAQSIVAPKRLGFAETEDAQQDYERMKSSVMEEVRRIFKPEFLNRIDDIIVFRMLNKDDMSKIAGLQLGALKKRMKEQMQIGLSTTPALVKYLVDKGYDPKYGARPLRRAITGELEDAISDGFLRGDFAAGDEVRLTVRAGKVVLEKK